MLTNFTINDRKFFPFALRFFRWLVWCLTSNWRWRMNHESIQKACEARTRARLSHYLNFSLFHLAFDILTYSWKKNYSFSFSWLLFFAVFLQFSCWFSRSLIERWFWLSVNKSLIDQLRPTQLVKRKARFVIAENHFQVSANIFFLLNLRFEIKKYKKNGCEINLALLLAIKFGAPSPACHSIAANQRHTKAIATSRRLFLQTVSVASWFLWEFVELLVLLLMADLFRVGLFLDKLNRRA